ncbi:uncharacterized protein LOC127260540 isoform X2 [Andrographis paniculata]|uniref:uncharacterized protein LOC127260540 isoform X2 n=1 Tax=Andrographis paniculata TaxID=175694 RepID=UPI0021E8E894|nr:uncharacterized protein LOC127260540 isoform X2 [Andrographis paniculata]
MQRQSLGSPTSLKLVKHEHLGTPDPSSSTASISASGSSLYGHKDCRTEADEALKKLQRPKPKSNQPETYIHLIPMLTLLCFLILYLSSHDPSAIDLAEFNGFKPRSDLQKENISKLQRIVDLKKEDMLAIRSLKNLEHTPARRHRKMARV